MIIQILISSAWAACDATISASIIEERLEEAENAFQKMDSSSFLQKKEEVTKLLPCVSDVFTPGQISSLYRVLMVDAFAQRDMKTFGGYAKAAKLTTPEKVITNGLVQEGHPIANLGVFAAQQQVAPRKEIDAPLNGILMIDGKETLSVPTDRPFLFQEVSKNGNVRQTKLITDLEIPAYELALRERNWTVQFQPQLAMAASSLAGLAIGSSGIAAMKNQKFWNNSTPNTELDSLQKQTNVWSGVAVGLGLGAVGCLTGSVIIGSW